tara:strand:+ start:3613 stop:3774 length:162 start_codon:yes stop_codon:yes gene_type:complete
LVEYTILFSDLSYLRGRAGQTSDLGMKKGTVLSHARRQITLRVKADKQRLNIV